VSDLSEMLDRLDMEDFLDVEGIQYRRTHGSSGPQLNVRECPVCGSTNWKVYLNAESGVGNCFAGDHPPGQNFTKWKFVRAHKEDATPAQVVEYLRRIAREMGWRPARKVSVAVEQTKQEWSLPESIELPHLGRNIPYLDNRGITGEYAKYFHLRYAKRGAYYRYKVKGDWCFQDHSQRVIIPVYDLDGNIVTFQGRDTTGKAEKKYLFPPGLDGTGVHLFNGLNVHNTKRIVVGEGAFDVAAIKIAFDADPGLRDVVPVGTFGKHLSSGSEKSQLAKFLTLKGRGVEEVTLMWDGEKQATDDAVEAGELLKQHGFRVRIALLPEGCDPNEVPQDVVCKAFYEAIILDSSSALRIRMHRRL
jgi:DNA primase